MQWKQSRNKDLGFFSFFSAVFFFSTNGTNSIAHYNKESRSAFKKRKTGTNSSLAWVERPPGTSGWGWRWGGVWEKRETPTSVHGDPGNVGFSAPPASQADRGRVFLGFLIPIFLPETTTTKRAQHQNKVYFKKIRNKTLVSVKNDYKYRKKGGNTSSLQHRLGCSFFRQTNLTKSQL